MFDIGFSEFLVIGIVALVVIGPERLPKVARTAGILFGRLQRYVAGVKADISREMELDELRKFRSEVETTARSVQASVRQEMSLAEQEIKAFEQEAEKTIQEATGKPAYGTAPDVLSEGSLAKSEMTPSSPSTATAQLPEMAEPHPETSPSPQMELPLNADPAMKPADR